MLTKKQVLVRIRQAYEHTYYNKNCFPNIFIYACLNCTKIRRQHGDWRKVKLSEETKCEYCKKKIK